jgi:2-methylfumaryl-CoA isomerase
VYQLLSGLRVIEGSSFIASPIAGLYLTQMGAEVIRFDQIGGGPDFRRWPQAGGNGASLYWEGLNAGKKSIAFDLSRPEGRELAQQLITAPGEGRGLFLTNYPVDGFLSHEDLAERRPDLITVRVMGQANGQPALDYTVNSALGFPLITGPDSLADQPVNHVLPAWDLVTGAYAAFALVSSERARGHNGKGQEIRIPLSDIGISTVATLGMLAEVLSQGTDRARYGNEVYGAFGRDFVTADRKRIMLMAMTPRQWKGMIQSLDLRGEVQRIEAERNVSFEFDEGVRFKHRDALFPLVEAAVGRRTLDSLASEFDRLGVCWGPYQSMHAAVHDPVMVTSNPIFSQILQKSGTTYPVSGAPATIPQTQRGAPRRAPHLGEHTDEVLAGVLGLSAAQIGRLHDAKLVAAAAAS